MDEKAQLKYGRLYTLLWGVFSIAVAMFATKMGSLIEAVNELGSLFYGSILGIFLTAFFLKHVKEWLSFMQPSFPKQLCWLYIFARSLLSYG